MHPVLSRQLRKAGLDAELAPTAEQWARFLTRTSVAYAQSDQDRYTVERSLDISSKEMQELYESLRSSSAALEAESNRLGAVITSLTSGLAVLDADGRVTMVNPAGLRLGKCSAADVLGRPLSDLFRIHIGELDQQDGGGDVTDSLAGGRAFQHDNGTLIQRDGSSLPISFSLLPINREGAPPEAVVVVRDITEDKRAEEELIRARGRGRGGQSSQVGVPRQHEPRDPHADERRHRHDRVCCSTDRADRRAARIRVDRARLGAKRCSPSSTTSSTSRRSRPASSRSRSLTLDLAPVVDDTVDAAARAARTARGSSWSSTSRAIVPATIVSAIRCACARS